MAVQTGSLTSILSALGKDDVNDSILKLMECPVCLEVLSPPIHQCANSHNVCGKCKSKIQTCPTCKQALLKSRSLFAEQVAELLLYPCKNVDVGCPERFSLKTMAKHEEECSHRLYKCLPGRATNCNWEGRSIEILDHMRASHEEACWMTEENNIYYEIDVFKGFEDLQVISAYMEAFWYNFKSDVNKEKLYLAVQYIGPQQLATNFTYSLNFFREDDPEVCMSIKKRTHPDTEKISSIYDGGLCIELSFDLLKQFVSGDKMTFDLGIAKVSDKVDPDTK